MINHIKLGSLVKIKGEETGQMNPYHTDIAYVIRAPIDVGHPHQGPWARCYKLRVVTKDGSYMPVIYVAPEQLELIT